MKKQTSANNEFLSAVKVLMNNKIYKRTAELVNLEGEEKALEYLQKFFATKISREYFLTSDTYLQTKKSAVYGWRYGTYQIIGWE